MTKGALGVSERYQQRLALARLHSLRIESGKMPDLQTFRKAVSMARCRSGVTSGSLSMNCRSPLPHTGIATAHLKG